MRITANEKAEYFWRLLAKTPQPRNPKRDLFDLTVLSLNSCLFYKSLN
jgi:hypothetical protein